MTFALVLVIAGLLATADQMIKILIYIHLRPDGSITIIDNLLSFVYTENRGAAFGVFQNGTLVFAVLTAALIGVFLYLLLSKKCSGMLFYTAVTFILGGGVGNLIDRIFRGFVIDYISVSFFPPVCNFADYCITIGAVLFIIYAIFLPDKSEKKKLVDDECEEVSDE